MDITNTIRTAETQEVQRLIREIEGLEGQFREQRAQLQRRGMSLPPGTLPALQQMRADLEALLRNYEESTRELNRLRELTRTAELVNSTLDLDDVLNEVMDRVIGLTRAERGYLMLRNPQTGEFEFRVARNIEHRRLGEKEFVVSNTIVRQVALSGVPVVTTNAEHDERFKYQGSIIQYGLRSILCVPLMLKGAITGVIYTDNPFKMGLFGEKELELLQTFANQSAVAIQNARLFAELRANLDAITAMNQLLDNVFASIASGVITTDRQDRVTKMNAAACRILALDEAACIGQLISDVWPVLPVETIAAIREEGPEDAETIELETEIAGRGTVSLNLRLSPLRDNAGAVQGVAIVVDDLTEFKRRESQLQAVRRYLTPVMVDNIQSIDKLALGGERRIVTTVFIDVRGFNTFPTVDPVRFMETLNRYLTVAAEAVTERNGVIDKYMANEIMALYNTQLNPMDDHAFRALLSVLDTVNGYHALYRQTGEAPGTRYYRIGLHTGVATLGNVGSEARREFTALGDSINLAHRLLENARPGEIVISAETYQAAMAYFPTPPAGLTVSPLEEITVKNRREPIRVYRLRMANE
jgi:PAS domain S-box-containing protein